MRRKLSLLFFAVAVTLISACSNVTGPNRDDDDQSGQPEFCGVVAGTHTFVCPDSIH